MFCATKARQRRVLILESREWPVGAKLKVDTCVWTRINRGFRRIKSLKRRHLSGYQCPPLAAASRETMRPGWPGIHMMFLHIRISRYSSEVNGDRPRRSVSKQRTIRTYASVCGTLEPLENRWTVLRVSTSPRDATRRPGVFPGSQTESLFYDCDALLGLARGPARLCTHAWRQDTVCIEPLNALVPRRHVVIRLSVFVTRE